jgi:tellurite resistance protein
VPPALIYLNGGALAGGPAGMPLEALFLCGLPLAAALLIASRGLRRWPFGPPWWAFTFPLDAMAAAAVRFAQEHPEAGWRALAAALLVLAGIFVTWVLSKTLLATASKKT